MTFFATIGWFLKRVVWFVKDNWKIVLPIFAVLIVVIFVNRACNKPAKLDEAAILKAQEAIAKEDRKEMIEILAESDNRKAEIDSSIKQIEMDREASKKNYTGWTNDEIAAELERRAKE